MNIAHNIRNAFVSILAVRLFFLGEATAMDKDDVFDAGYQVGQVFYYLVVNTIFEGGIPPDPFDTLNINKQ